MSKVSMDKVYKTRNGDPVRVLCLNRGGKWPVVALVGPHQEVLVYCSNGKFHEEPHVIHNSDLIEVVPEKWHYVVKHSEGYFSVSDYQYPSEKGALEAFKCRNGYGTLAGVWKE